MPGVELGWPNVSLGFLSMRTIGFCTKLNKDEVEIFSRVMLTSVSKPNGLAVSPVRVASVARPTVILKPFLAVKI